MKMGKVQETILKRTIFKQLQSKRSEVLVGPEVGEDCSVLKFEEDELCVVSTDPITGAVHTIGNLAVNITANDLASSGAEPLGILLTILLPRGFSEANLKDIIKDVNESCMKLSIQVIGGHTEVTDAVNQPILSVTGIGKVKSDKLILTQKAEVGQDIIMTKWAGLEGTAILAHDHEEQLKAHFNSLMIENAKALSEHISVVKESIIAVKLGATSMHDITEGGVFGALWELAASAKVGLEVDLDAIPIKQETIEICEYYDLNPYKLMSSGCMLITTFEGEKLIKELNAAHISASCIGKIVEGNDKTIIQSNNKRSLEPPKTDELYRVISQ